MRFKRKKDMRDPFRRAILTYLNFFQEFFPSPERAETIAKIERGETVRVSALELWTEAFNAGLPCEADLREAATEGIVFEVLPEEVKFIRMKSDE